MAWRSARNVLAGMGADRKEEKKAYVSWESSAAVLLREERAHLEGGEAERQVVKKLERAASVSVHSSKSL